MIFKTTELTEVISSVTTDLASTLVEEWNAVYDKLQASTTDYGNYIDDRIENLEPFKTVKRGGWISTAFSRLTGQPFFFNREVYPKDYVEAGEASFARRNNMETVEPISISADIVKHGHFTVRQVYTDNGRYERKSRLEVEITLSTKELSFLSKDVLSAPANEVGEVFVERIVNEFWETDQINPVYDTSTPLVYKSKYSGPVVLKDGTLFYLYKNLKDTDKRAEYQRLVAEQGGKYLPNYLICIDVQNGVLFQTNSSGESVVIDLKGMNKPSEELVSKLFNSTCSQVISSGRAGSLFSTLNLSRLLSEEDLLFWSTNAETPLVATENLLPNLLKLKEVYEGHKHNVLPSTYLKCIGLIQLLLENAKTAKTTVAKVAAKREKFDAASTEDLPKVANLREDLVFLPHQAACLTKLDVAEATAILDVGTGGGKCLIGNTLVPSSLGILSLKEYWETSGKPLREGFKEHCFEVYSTEGYSECIATYTTKGKTIQIRFNDGSIVEGLPEHKLICYVNKEYVFKRLDEITKSDVLVKQLNTELYGSNLTLEVDTSDQSKRALTSFAKNNYRLPEKVTLDLAKLLGYLVAEGTFNCGISFTNHDPDIMLDFLSLRKRIFGVPFSTKNINKDTGVGSIVIDSFLTSLCGSGWSKDRVIPKCIRTAPKEYQCAFLSTLFEGDGSIYRESAVERWTLEYCSISRELIQQVKVLLENMGIHCEIQWKSVYTSHNPVEGDRKKRAYILYVSQPSIRRFNRLIGFVSSRKQNRLDECCDYIQNLKNNSQNTNYWVHGLYNKLPLQDAYTELVAEIDRLASTISYEVQFGKQKRICFYSFNTLNRVTNCGRLKSKTGITRYAVKRILHLIKNSPQEVKALIVSSKKCKELVRLLVDIKDKYFVKPVVIKHCGEKQVYDLSVPGPKSYLANGFMSHNTMMLIADALNILAKTGGKNPLIVVPNSIVGQWIGQIQFFTNNSVNAVPLTTETINNWGEEGLEELIASAPKNTIFLTTYSFLTNGAEDLGHDYKFPRVEWLLDRLDPTYVALDESHFCKNPEALRTKAVLKLKDIPYRRLATGTLISNTPNDLIGQIAFLDPKIVGDSEEFAARYGAYQDGRGRVLEWKPNAADLIRKDLRENSYYIVAREKDWAGSLPKITYNRELVKLTVNQQKMYKVIVEEVLSEIMDDPNLRQQWLDFINSGNDEESSMSAVLLGKLAKLEQFLTAPDRSEFIKYVSGEDAISPKLAKIDELIEDSISKGYKCIVAVHYKHSARHLLEHSKYKSVGIYYDASHRDNLSKFQNQDNIKVMFAVITSITEGVNLQMANRIVIADVDWTSGKLKQLIARIYRPHIKIEDGKVKNLNKGKTVYIDTVLAENSADTLKYLFQTYKKIFNSSVMENCPVEIPGRPTINDNTLTASFQELGGERTLGLDDQYNDWFNQGVEEMRGRNGDPVPVRLRKPLDVKLIDTPWVVGMPLSTEGDEISLTDFMEDNGLDLEDARNSKKELVGKFVKGEFGTGKITGVYKNSVRIKDADGETYTTPITKVVVVPERTKVDRKKVEEEAEQLTSDNAVELLIINYNDLPTLVADFEDPDNKELKKFKFHYQGPYKYFPIQNARQGLRKLDAIEKKYKIVGRAKIEEIIEDVQDSSYEYEVSDLKNFFKLKHVKAKPGTVKLYALIEDGAPYIVYDIATNPGVSIPGFKTAEGYFYRSANNNGELKTVLQQIIKSFKITNLKELKAMARELKIKL